MKKQIPNIITLMNFLCGVLSILALISLLLCCRLTAR